MPPKLSSANRKKAEFVLKRKLDGCRSDDMVMRAVIGSGNPITAEILSHCIFIIAKSGPTSRGIKDASFTQVLAGSAQAVADSNQRQLCKLLGALAKLELGRSQVGLDDFMGWTEKRVMEVMDTFDAMAVSNVLWSIARTRADTANPVLLNALLQRAEQTSAAFNSKDISNTLWSLATMKKGVSAISSLGPAVEAIQQRCVALGTEMKGKELVTSYWALVRLLPPHAILEPLHTHLQHQMINCIGQFNNQDIATSLWIIASINNDNRVSACTTTLVSALPGNVGGFSQQDIANSMWALQKLDASITADTTSLIVKRAMIIADRLSAFQLPQVAACLPKLSEHNNNTLRSKVMELTVVVENRTCALAHEFSLQGIVATTRALARLRRVSSSRRLVQQFYARLIVLNTSKAIELDAQQLATLVHSFGVLVGGSLLEAGANDVDKDSGASENIETNAQINSMLAKKAVSMIGSMDANDGCGLLWGLARLGVGFKSKQRSTLLSELFTQLEENKEIAPLQIVNLLWAVQKLNLSECSAARKDDGATMTKIWEIAVKSVPQLSATSLGGVAWAAACSNHPITQSENLIKRIAKQTVVVASDLCWKDLSRLDIWTRSLQSNSTNKYAKRLSRTLSDQFPTAMSRFDTEKVMFLNKLSDAWNTHIKPAITSVDKFDSETLKILVVNDFENLLQRLLKADGYDVTAKGLCWNTIIAQDTEGTKRKSLSLSKITKRWPYVQPNQDQPRMNVCVMVLPLGKEAFDMALHVIAARLQKGAKIVVVGSSRKFLTVHSTVLEPLFAQCKTLYNSGGIAVVEAVLNNANDADDGDTKPIKPSCDDWMTKTHIELEGCHDDKTKRNSKRRKWKTFPGLFAGGLVDVMTSALIEILPEPLAGSRCLDFACGSGVITAALLLQTSTLKITMLDADVLALIAAKQNLKEAETVLSDCWRGMNKAEKYSWIVSNPPVHVNDVNDHTVMRELIDGAPAWLEKNGQLWLVAQELVPVGLYLKATGLYISVRHWVIDDRFVVWCATTGTCEVSCENKNHKPKDMSNKRKAIANDDSDDSDDRSNAEVTETHTSKKPKTSKTSKKLTKSIKTKTSKEPKKSKKSKKSKK